jgi:hypothetical protein
LVTVQWFNRNYSVAASVLFRPGSEGDFGSPERTLKYVRKPKLQSGSGMGSTAVRFANRLKPGQKGKNGVATE